MQNIISTDPTYILTVQHNRTLTAIFEADVQMYTITAAIDPAGSGTVTGAGQYQEGAQATITAVPAEGYAFTAWQEGGAAVSTAAEYTFAVTGDRTLTAVFAVKKPSRLPDGYTETEYIQSTGTQFIDTGFVPTVNTKTVVDVQPTVTNTSTSQVKYECFFGTLYRKSAGSGKYNYYVYQCYRTVAGNWAVVINGKTSNVATSIFDKTNYGTSRIKVTMDAKNSTAFINTKTPAAITVSTSVSNLGSLYLLGRRTSSTSVSNWGLSAKLYSCQIYDSDTLVRDLVPCIDPTGAIGMYDLANGGFHKNAGSGTLTAGPAV